MRVSFKASERATVVVEGKGTAEAFRALAAASEIFRDRRCNQGCECHLVPVHYVTQQGYDYHEWRCPKCGWRFRLGERNDDSGNLFPSGWEAPYDGGQGGQQRRQQPTPQNDPNRREPPPTNHGIDEDDIPF